MAAKLVSVAFAATAATALAIPLLDRPVALAVAGREPWPVWDPFARALEYAAGVEPWRFGLVAVLCAAVAATLLVPRWAAHRRDAMYVAVVYLLARNLMFWGKVGTARLRPTEWLARGGDPFWRAGGVSFPSGHVVLVAGLIIPLAVVAPRTRPLLALVPLVMIARVAVNAHFVSDVTAGLALVALVAWLCAPLRASRR